MFTFQTVLLGVCLISLSCLHPVIAQDRGNREKRSPKFIAGPNGEICILNDAGSGDQTYEVRNDDGTTHPCDTCGIGEFVGTDCTEKSPTRCLKIEKGKQRMPYRNKCHNGYDCKQCPLPSVVDTPCDSWGSEDTTTCKCLEGFFLANELTDLCRPVPRCNAGSEPGDGAQRSCQPCRDGFFQLKNNSTEMCRKHSDCIQVAGTLTSDSVCKNDPSPTSTSRQQVHPPDASPTVHPPDASPTVSIPDLVTDFPADFGEKETTAQQYVTDGKTSEATDAITDGDIEGDIDGGTDVLNNANNPQVDNESFCKHYWIIIVAIIVSVICGIGLMPCIRYLRKEDSCVFCKRSGYRITSSTQTVLPTVLQPDQKGSQVVQRHRSPLLQCDG